MVPTKNLECGTAAIGHGADAVYIGAPKFDARATVVNSLEDITALMKYTHLYNVQIYVTVNTTPKDEELKETEEMIRTLYRVGVDALVVQDMGITDLELPPIPLHASTRMDNRAAEKVRFLTDAGFRQVVLARKLSLREIGKIHGVCSDVSLEIFMHGALCVSYSEQCRVSQACFGRSANRGEYAQFCRLPFSLVDSNGRVTVKDKHLLSFKDFNQSEELEALPGAGASSFKIGDRLKDISYVKNVTAAYHQKLDTILACRKECVRASSDSCRCAFNPQLDKSFSRGFTHYFLHRRTRGVFSFDTPKSLGGEMETMKEARRSYLAMAGLKLLSNSDGICYIDEQDKLQGFHINYVEGDRLYPQEMPRIKPRTVLYRSFDQEFEKILVRRSPERKMVVVIQLTDTAFGFALTLTDEDDSHVTLSLLRAKEPARTSQEENLKTRLAKLGNTPFEVERVDIDFTENWFLSASILADFHRQTIEKLIAARRISYWGELAVFGSTTHALPQTTLTHLENVMNARVTSFYARHGTVSIIPAFEQAPVEKTVLMFCKHCLRCSMGWCPVHQRERSPYREPYYLVSADGKHFHLEFGCRNCQMKVSAL